MNILHLRLWNSALGFGKNMGAKILSTLAIFAFMGNASAQTPDPGLPGTYAVSKAQYNLGDHAWYTSAFPDSLEVRGSVHYPTTLSGGPFPVLFWLHGRHETCYDTSTYATNSIWPCPTGWSPIVSYEGYDYAARTMASHGYIVISISCNAINATDAGVADRGMEGRGELMQHHMNLWNTYNTSGGAPFGTMFVGKLNMQNIGTMGHSRGGEGAVYNALYNKSLGSPYGIKAVLTLAPVDFYSKVLSNIPLLDISPYCDGDVSDIQGVHFYDMARYSDSNDQASKHTILFLGANHNYFNTVWTPVSYIAGGGDDWLYAYSAFDPQCGTASAKRFDTTKQKAAFNTYAAAFYRLYLGHETKFAPILEVKNIVPPASSLLDTSNVFVSYHPGKSDRLDINRTDSLSRDTINTLYDTVLENGLISYKICNSGLFPACGLTSFTNREPHRPYLAEMAMHWGDTLAWYQNDIPSTHQDLSPFQDLMFRATVNFKESPKNIKVNFTVQLIDSSGLVSSLPTNNYSNALFYQPGTDPRDLPKAMFNSISIPLSDFTGINLKKVRKIKFLFNKSDSGSILISDLAFTNPLCGNHQTNFTDSMGTRYKIFFKNKSIGYAGDTLTYLWKFGDPASGTKDTSSHKDTTHVYTTHGTFHPCLYVTTHRANGFNCTDSMCTTVTMANDGIPEIAGINISIYPNPAKDQLHIDGAESTDVLKLFNLYGQVVLSATLNNLDISLPQNLTSGIYYALIVTQKGNAYKKIVIAR